jgi:ribokinase
MTRDIVIVGSLNMDVVVQVPRFPGEGETLHAASLATGPGGKGANQAVACARTSGGSARGAVHMVGCVGDDAHGDALRRVLEHDGVDTTHVRTQSGPSGTAFVFVEPDGRNRIVIVAGANAALRDADIDACTALFASRPLVLLQLEVPVSTVMHAAATAHAHGCTVVLNPSPMIDIPERLWRSVDVVVANEVEARQITGIDVATADQAQAAARALLAKGPFDGAQDRPSLAVVTLGADGVVALGSATRGGAIEHHRVPARRVQALDTTAAGDTFTGAFCAALAAGRPVAAALQRGVDAAAICVTRRGAMASVPYAAEVDAAA